MIKIVLVFIWFALAVIIEAILGTDSPKNATKHILLAVLTLPIAWLTWSKKILTKILPLTLTAKVKTFFTT